MLVKTNIVYLPVYKSRENPYMVSYRKDSVSHTDTHRGIYGGSSKMSQKKKVRYKGGRHTLSK